MSNIHQIELGPETTPLQQGRSAHGRWRYAYQRAATEGERVPALLSVTQDADRLAFALAEGPASQILARHLTDYLWTRETADDDWPQNLRGWLADMSQWEDAPAGRTGFICGRLERNAVGGRIFLAWLGMGGIRLLDRDDNPVTLDTAIGPDEAWTPRHGPEPVGMALHAYRGTLFDLDRLVAFTSSAAPLGEELPDLGNADLQQGLDDWSQEEEVDHDLVVYDLRINPVLTEPATVLVTHRWTSPDLCVLSWNGSPMATGYRIEEASLPTFEDANLLAEMGDRRQTQYSFTPPTSSLRYYRVTPLNQSVPGAPSDPVSVTPMTLPPPILEPVRWSEEGGYHLSWTHIAQATGYEVQTSSAANFDSPDAQVIYRGEIPEVFLHPDTPPSRYYRVRAINVLYAPHGPSAWSTAQRAPSRLATPAFTEVTQKRIAWQPVPGARQYALQVTSPDSDDEGETLYTIATDCQVARQPAVYRVRALRRPNEHRTASAWSDPVTVMPAQIASGGPPRLLRSLIPVLAGAGAVALAVGAALGLIGMQVFQSHNATPTRTPIPSELLMATATVHQANIENATTVSQLGMQNQSMRNTLEAQIAAEQTRASIPTVTPSITPNLTETFEAGLNQALTATAANWTDTPTATDTATPTDTPTNTPTPTITPNLSATVALEVIQALTATAASWTETPSPTTTPTPTDTQTPEDTHTPTLTLTPSFTPNMSATVAVMVAQAMTATAAGWTETPLPTDTFTPEPTVPPTDTPEVSDITQPVIDASPTTETATTHSPGETPDLTATVGSAVEAALAATLTAQPTIMPTDTPTRTLTPSQTPDMTATVDALIAANLPAGCFVLAETDLPVYAGPSTAYRQVAGTVPRLAEVIARWETLRDGQPVERWLAVTFVQDEVVVSGWLSLPEETAADTFYNGSACQPDVHVPLFDPASSAQAGLTGLCVVRPVGQQFPNIRSGPSQNERALARLMGPRVVLERRDTGDNTGPWLRLWLDDQGIEGWVAEGVSAVSPQDCAANFES